jgi:hypothetical protein
MIAITAPLAGSINRHADAAPLDHAGHSNRDELGHGPATPRHTLRCASLELEVTESVTIAH